MIDDLLLQEIYSLREQIKILIRMLKFYEPDLDASMILHSLGHCDFQEYAEYYNEEHKEANMETFIDCRSETGITVGLIDGIITFCHILARRDLQPAEIIEALCDLVADEDLKFIISYLEQARE